MRALLRLAGLSAALLITPVRAETVAAPVFGRHMVLQRDRTVKVWGTDLPGQPITVRFAGQIVEAKAGPGGAWQVELSATPAGGPFELVIKGSSELLFDDVLVGDVWFASGQSNMTFPIQDEDHAAATIPAADFPQIRFLQIQRKVSREPFRLDGSWQAASPATVPKFSAVAFYFARDLYENLHVPIGVIPSTWGGTRIEPWVPLAGLEAHPDFKNLRSDWDKKVEWDPAALQKNHEAWTVWHQTKEALRPPFGEPPLINGPEEPNTPGLLFQSMVQPFIPFTLRGVIWYQGEYNGLSPGLDYFQLFTLLIREWRRAWAQPDLPFLFVQLPNFNGGNPQSTNWADVRAAQQQALALPYTGMAVALDLGAANDIHPKNKLDVGLRLALVARAQVYDEKIPYQGPTLTQINRLDDAVALRFDHAGNGLALREGGNLQGLEATGADGQFHPVAAKIEGPDTIILPGAANIAEIRYAWHNDPQPPPNLINGAHLPAPPFRLRLKN